MSEFAGKVVIVTGASSGIGEATALAFARKGARVAINGRNKERLREVAEECGKCDGCEVLEIVSDLTDFDNLKPIIDKTVEKFGGIDILVNNAGIGGGIWQIENLELEGYQKVLDLNLRAPVFLSKFALPFLKKSKGNVINVSSVVAFKCFPRSIPYCMTKSALDHFTRGFAAECASFGVRVNSVNPGVVKTRFHERLGITGINAKAMDEKIKSIHPLGVISSEVIADTILFMCSSSHMTGSSVLVDSGMLFSS